MDFMEVVRKRRSIRRYRPDLVEEDKLMAVLEAARLAPSWKNGQCWTFLVVQSPEMRQAIFGTMPESNPGRKAIPAAPVTIVLCADPEASGVVGDMAYYMLDAGLAMEHLMLAATALGLGTCWQGLFDEKALKTLLGVPEKIRIVALTPLGYPDQDPNPRPRKELQDMAYGEIWGQSLFPSEKS